MDDRKEFVVNITFSVLSGGKANMQPSHWYLAKYSVPISRGAVSSQLDFSSHGCCKQRYANEATLDTLLKLAPLYSSCL